jgi:uncharacterized protein
MMKIAVIGAGAAGLTTAWLLEEQHEVTLFEQQDRLGGHAHTLQVERAGEISHIDAGFEFFSQQAFPLFNRLLRALDVPLRSFTMRLTLEQAATRQPLLVPPVHAGKLMWSALTPHIIWELLQLRFAIGRATPLVQAGDPFVTIEEFLRTIPLSQRFRADVLLPFLQLGWCLPLEEFLHFSAYDVMKLMVLHRGAGLFGERWQEIVGGTQTYIRLLAQSLTRTQLRLSTPMRQIERDEQGLLLVDDQGQPESFDRVVLATSASGASRLLTTLAGSEALCQRLGKVEYFQTKIAVHGDKRWMPRQPRHWSVINIRAQSPSSAVTVWKPWRGQELFRSWVTYASALPDPLYGLLTFSHPKPNRQYFEAQAYLETVQGHNHLWLAGMYTQDVDLHESAIRSAVRVAQGLAPDAPRLRQLLDQMPDLSLSSAASHPPSL